jgi:hypothetical protein
MTTVEQTEQHWTETATWVYSGQIVPLVLTNDEGEHRCGLGFRGLDAEDNEVVRLVFDSTESELREFQRGLDRVITEVARRLREEGKGN